jgi:hypothetical protein
MVGEAKIDGHAEMTRISSSRNSPSGFASGGPLAGRARLSVCLTRCGQECDPATGLRSV